MKREGERQVAPQPQAVSWEVPEPHSTVGVWGCREVALSRPEWRKLSGNGVQPPCNRPCAARGRDGGVVD